MSSAFPLIKTEIKTNDSFLNIYSFPNKKLVEDCIKEASSKLKYNMNRKVGFFSDTVDGMYSYGKLQISESQPLTPSLKLLLDIMNSYFKTDFNGIIINYYKNGSEYIAKHSDSKNHPPVGVLIISSGITRNFRVFDKKSLAKVKDIPLIDGQVLHMGGDFQKEFEHDIEKDFNIFLPRYSLSMHKYMNLGLY